MSPWEEIAPDAIESLYDRPGFVPVYKYETVTPEAGEVGSVNGVRFTLGDPVIAQRRQEIRAARWGNAKAAPELRAECAVMGHVRMSDKSVCLYCGSE